jgi:hypothetical protein
MKFLISIIFPKNQVKLVKNISTKSNREVVHINSKKDKNNKNNSNMFKNKNVDNLIFVLFSCFFLNSKTNAISPNYNSQHNLASVVVDGNLLGVKREDIFNDKFLFSNQTTQNTEIESEIEEIEDDEFRYSSWKNSQVGLTVGGSALSMWFAYKGLNVWEKWMKDQEQKDIEEEIEMTGTYINPGAGNVESSIDPITGKKIEIKTNENKNKKDVKFSDNE